MNYETEFMSKEEIENDIRREFKFAGYTDAEIDALLKDTQ